MNQNNPLPLVVIAGPTAVGKSALAVALAHRTDGEIISADSMQVYRGMDIGTAKITPEEMEGVPHHLLNILEPEEAFDAFRFQELARSAVREISGRGHLPIVTGGTGFYIRALLYDTCFSDHDGSQKYREELGRIGNEPDGSLKLHGMLREVDPVSAAAIHPNNQKRMIRALEYFHENGRPISEHNQEERQRTSPYRFACFVLCDDREKLYDRIDKRVDRMMDEGLLEEVMRLRSRGCHSGMVSMQGIGYKQILGYLDGRWSLEEAVRLIKRDSRHYAKRQLTWFRRETDVIWLDRRRFADEEAILGEVLRTLKERGI